MKISEELPQFEETKTLLVIAGDQTARFLNAFNGRIEELETFKIENPQYSDREGHFKKRGKGETFSSGAVYEGDDSSVRSQFYQQLADELKKIDARHDIEDIILFAPAHSIKDTKSHIPSKYQSRIRERVKGNYIHQHPHELLETYTKEDT